MTMAPGKWPRYDTINRPVVKVKYRPSAHGTGSNGASSENVIGAEAYKTANVETMTSWHQPMRISP